MKTYILIEDVFARLIAQTKEFLTIQTKPGELKMVQRTNNYEEVLLLDSEVPQLQMNTTEEEALLK